MRIRCELIIHNSKSLHLNQIIAGFVELEKSGVVEIYDKVLNDTNYSYLEVILNNRIRIIYDTQDDGNVFIPNLDWNNIDFYFKRSYKSIMKNKISNKIYPLGLNYDVNSRYKNYHTTEYNIKDFLKRILKKGKNNFILEDFEVRDTKESDDLKICFLTRFWDPYDKSIINESDEVKKERDRINRFRAECIRACRNKYGEDFIGGVCDSKYARIYYPDCIVKNKKITERFSYINILKKYDICIATTGLHKSIGWKFAEYIAMGKVVITEPLEYEVCGDFIKDQNYLEFTSVEELLNKIDRVREDRNLARKIKNNNINYYNKFLRADRLIFNTIKIALGI